MTIRSALPSILSGAVFSGAVRSAASIAVEDEDGAVFAADLDRLAGVGALVESVETRFRIEAKLQPSELMEALRALNIDDPTSVSARSRQRAACIPAGCSDISRG